MGGPAEDHNVYYREGWSPSHSHSVPVVTKVGVPMGVASVGASPRGLLRQNESQWVELVLELHHGDSKDKVSPGGWS